MKPRIKIVKPGSCFAEMILRFGDYDAWFARSLGDGVVCRVYEAAAGRLPDPGDADAWILTGRRDRSRDRTR